MNNIEQLSKVGSLKDFNIAIIVADSLRFDSVSEQWDQLTTLAALGDLHQLTTLAPYTPAAHTAMFAGHFPTAPGTKVPFIDETFVQPFRILTAPARDADKGCGMLLEGNNIIEGFRRENMVVNGVGGVSQFSTGSFLRERFPWSSFQYFGPDMDEEPLAPRATRHFPLEHVDQIIDGLPRKEANQQSVLFANLPNTHYPWDDGHPGDIPSEVTDQFPLLKQKLNLRTHKGSLSQEEENQLFTIAPKLHEMQKRAVRTIDAQLDSLFTGLRLISDRDWFVIFTGDHGDNFGETRTNLATGSRVRHYGHMHFTPECFAVPGVIGILPAITGGT
ncbi:MAG: sulfatase-like hydrolase/transferase [bacterium]